MNRGVMDTTPKQSSNQASGSHQALLKDVKQKSLEGLKNIPISEFKKCFEQWKDRLQKCVVVKGEYFEGDDNLV